MDDLNLDEKSLNMRQYLQLCKFVMPGFFTLEGQIILGSNLVLVTLHRRFTSSIEQDK